MISLSLETISPLYALSLFKIFTSKRSFVSPLLLLCFHALDELHRSISKHHPINKTTSLEYTYLTSHILYILSHFLRFPFLSCAVKKEDLGFSSLHSMQVAISPLVDPGDLPTTSPMRRRSKDKAFLFAHGRIVF